MDEIGLNVVHENMRTQIAVLAVIFAFSCNSDSPTEPRPPTEPLPVAVLSGRTIDPHGVPVPRVTIRIVSPPNNIDASAVSEDSGYFIFNGLAPGTYGLKVRVNGGTEQSSGHVSIVAGANAHDIVVSSCKHPYGNVRDANTGRPIAGAKVTIFYRETTTDVTGHYRIDFGCDFVQGSTITMSAEHPDYWKVETFTRASGLCTCAHDFLLARK